MPDGASGTGAPRHPGWTLAAVVIGSAVVFLDGTVVNVALETIGRDLPATALGRLEGLTYVTSGYLTVLAALLVLAGALGDTYGRRRVFGVGLIGFGATSVLCGVAPTLELLVVARLLQGAAGALLVPGALAIITATWEGEERGRAIGTWAAATSAVTILGPFLGGVLVQTVSWRAAFLVNIPLVLLGAYALRFVEESRDEGASGHFDWLGAAVIAVGVGGLTFGATRGQQERWSDPLAYGAIVVGLVALIAFPVLMARRRHPLVPLEIFRSRAFTTINLSTFVIYGALYMNMSFQQLFLQGVLGYSPVAAALGSLPAGLLLMVLSTRFGRMAGRRGPRLFLVVGPALMAAGVLYLARIPSSSAAWVITPSDAGSFVPSVGYLVDVLPGAVVGGIGISILVAPLSTALMSSVPSRRAGLASAINNAVSRAGAPLVGALLFIAISATFYPTLASLVPGQDTSSAAFRDAVQPLSPPAASLGPAVAAAARDASTSAFHLAMWVAAALLASGAVMNWVGMPAGAPAGARREGKTSRSEGAGGPEGAKS